MRVKHEEGYQAILYKNKEFDLTPIAGKNKLKDLVSACEKARESGAITAYIIRHIEAKYVVLSDVDLELI